MSDHTEAARELMARIRRQVFVPEVTTMGACPRCGNGSRGAGTCADCLGRYLDALTDGAAGSAVVAASRALLRAQGRVRMLVDEELAYRDVLRRAGDGGG